MAMGLDKLKEIFVKSFGDEHKDLQTKINRVKHPKELLPYVRELLKVYLQRREELLETIAEQDENIEKIKQRIERSKGAMGRLLRPTLKTELQRFTTFAQRYVKNEARIRELYQIEEVILSVREEVAIPADLIEELNDQLYEINEEYMERAKALEESQNLYVKNLDKEDVSIIDEFRNDVYENLPKEEKPLKKRKREKLMDFE